MTRLGALRFKLAAISNYDTLLERFGDKLDELSSEVEGKSVALIGNARALAQGSDGCKIDKADVVIRINRAPMPSAKSHGVRTDWLALATSLPRGDFARLNAKRLIWVSHKRKRLRYWMARSPGFVLFPRTRLASLWKAVGTQPTTGLVMLAWLAETGAARIDLYGFDFFASQSLSGRRTAEQVPHDFGSERDWVEALMARDPRVTLHAME